MGNFITSHSCVVPSAVEMISTCLEARFFSMMLRSAAMIASAVAAGSQSKSVLPTISSADTSNAFAITRFTKSIRPSSSLMKQSVGLCSMNA